MTETQWQAEATGPRALLDFVDRTIGARRLLLVSAAALRLIEHLLPDHHRPYIDLIERFVEQNATSADLENATRELREYRRGIIDGGYRDYWQEPAPYALLAALDPNVRMGNRMCLDWVLTAYIATVGRGRKQEARGEIRQALCRRVREVVGNPFRPWRVVPAFLGDGLVQPDGDTVHPSEAARRLAEQIHRERAYDRLPILADALEESGVTDAEILAHCRNEAEHVRGCWAVDVACGRVGPG